MAVVKGAFALAAGLAGTVLLIQAYLFIMEHTTLYAQIAKFTDWLLRRLVELSARRKQKAENRAR